jgi:hypothetical protein
MNSKTAIDVDAATLEKIAKIAKTVDHDGRYIQRHSYRPCRACGCMRGDLLGYCEKCGRKMVVYGDE